MILARAKIRSPCRTGRNGIDIDRFERAGIPALGKAFQRPDSVAIMLNPHPRTDVVKRQPEVHLITVTEVITAALAELLHWLKATPSLKL